MYVVKRDGHKEPVMFDKITDRIKKLCYGLNDLVDAVKVAMRVIEGLYDGVTTSELDNLAAETAASMTIAHPDYAQLAARIAISNLHKNTNKSFSETMNEMYHYPFLCVGWFGMFVTSLNMLPMGQLDGGHITFAMFGSKQSIIARISWWIIFSLGIGSFLGWFYEQIVVESPGEFYTTIQSILLPTFLWIKLHAPWIYNGWNGWLFWALITRFFIT